MYICIKHLQKNNKNMDVEYIIFISLYTLAILILLPLIIRIYFLDGEFRFKTLVLSLIPIFNIILAIAGIVDLIEDYKKSIIYKKSKKDKFYKLTHVRNKNTRRI